MILEAFVEDKIDETGLLSLLVLQLTGGQPSRLFNKWAEQSLAEAVRDCTVIFANVPRVPTGFTDEVEITQCGTAWRVRGPAIVIDRLKELS